MIGDVHGCIVQLEKLLTKVPQDHRIVLVGDYVDRGEHSAEVLRLISARPDLTCLKGNHEEMMLWFLSDPTGQGRRWLRYGGLQTLASFDLHGVQAEMSNDELIECRDRLQKAMGNTLFQWVAELRTWEMSGNVLTVHAGADPKVPPSEQSEKTLIWGHPSFQSKARRDGVWVVHGHTIVNEASAQQGRISIDTGAFVTGVLSAVCLDGTEPRFLTSRD
ncbi:metallophosphoesterase family protein [Ruegeria denitrificans]|uniref:metallophosphoesterase family protein n=1 Tax=Ruegeria denitrificans TaxID=1715692 RepID=UPI002436FD45|nr:metallophosphoesterase family protein [Ruegeria denitrificans]